jgi:hypothetical protein
MKVRTNQCHSQHEMMRSRLIVQAMLMAAFASIPLLWFVFALQLDGVSSLVRLDLNSALETLIKTPFIDSIRATGLILLTTAFLQYHLPFGLLPRFLPVFSTLDRMLFLTLVAFGSTLVGISYLVR